jgi:hypothetical protein
VDEPVRFVRPIPVPQIKVNNDGLGSYFAVVVPGVHTNQPLSDFIKQLADLFSRSKLAPGSLFVCDVADRMVKVIVETNDRIEAFRTVRKSPSFVILHFERFFLNSPEDD